ncbi:hypothetical protein Leryth_016437 [Lithospermum erythrorhizon]|nr:hypothetical protein Leryth_016437 [Lithospermum erythrorhizon]
MDMMSNFRPESHVAQESRRHKLRHHNHMEDYGTTDYLEQLSTNQGVNTTDFMQIRGCRYGNISYDPSLFTPPVLEPNRESTEMDISKRIPLGDGYVANLSNTLASSYNSSAKESRDIHNSDNWEGIASPQICNWSVADYASESGGIGKNSEQSIVGVGLAGGRNILANNSLSSLDLRPGCYGEDVNNYSSPSLYQNTLQDVVSSATRGNKDSKMKFSAQQSVKETGWSEGRYEPVPPRSSSNQWMDRSNNNRVDSKISDSGGLRGLRCSSQGLSLSLSVPPSMKRADPVIGDCFDNLPASARTKDGNNTFGSNSKLSVPSNSSHDMVVEASSFNHRAVGPLGPFTGYATILSSSKFLRPAEQLLENFCNVASPDAVRACQASGKLALNDGFSFEPLVRASGGDSAGSSSTSFSSNDKKAKLLYLQYEVGRRCKMFHQQMQLVVSSFESIAGLRSAAPYFSLVLDKISKHFKALKNTISDQIRNLRNTIGEDSSSPASMSKLKFIDPGMSKQVVSGGSAPMFESQSQVWRPQRGLPERAVAVLRAWLFDHFLHPYPTDTEKHMLANQTSLTRNQVSNWFINARVRVWKPMIEEIHMLEGKGLGESSDTNAGKTDDVTRPVDEQDMDSQIDCPGVTVSTGAGNRTNDDLWNLGKRPCPDYRTPATTINGSVIGFSPYHRTGIGMEGLGAVTLTLGLRQSVEAVQQQELQHFGGQMIHDFVG